MTTMNQCPKSCEAYNLDVNCNYSQCIYISNRELYVWKLVIESWGYKIKIGGI